MPLVATAEPPQAHCPAAAPLSRLGAQLHEVARRIGRHDAAAGAALAATLAPLLTHPDPRATGLLVFAQALAERLADGSAAVIRRHLQRFEAPQPQLLKLLDQHLPMARMATRLANEALAQALRGEPHPALVDIGMGNGRQISALLDELAAAGELPRTLTLVGIEPDPEALAQAQEILEAQAARLGLALRFHAFAKPVEALDAGDWARIAVVCRSAPVLNAAFALHHIAAHDTQHVRDHVLTRLAGLRPRRLVLTERDADHLEPRYAERFGHCLTHYGALFRVLDALPLPQAERDALKVGWYGRQISDILGQPEARRSARHEPAERWAERLRQAGFGLSTPALSLPDSGHPTLRAQPRDGHIAITGAGEPLLALLVAAPEHGVPPGARRSPFAIPAGRAPLL